MTNLTKFKMTLTIKNSLSSKFTSDALFMVLLS